MRINFDGFRQLLEEIGCLEIDVPKDIDDPLFPDDNLGYDPFSIKAGHYCMDADTALKYARTRHADSDFGRLRRQQQVLVAIKNKVLDTGQLPHLIARLPALLEALSSTIKTDIPPSQQIALANLARKLSAANIRQLVIDEAMTDGTMISGASVLMPNMALIGSAVANFFNPSEVPTPAPVDTFREELRRDNATVAVLNGTTQPDLP